MRFRIEWLEPAKQDLLDIVAYVANNAPLVALGIQEEFNCQLAVLEEFPFICQKNAFFENLYDFKIKGLPYVIVCEILAEKKCVEILAVLHERRNRSNPDNYHF